MADCTRRVLETLSEGNQPFHHSGLGLERYLRKNGDSGGANRLLLKRAAASTAPPAYQVAYERWQRVLASRPNTELFTGALGSPLAVGLGEESSREIGLTLHQTYGVPFIPGSSLKGLARAIARQKLTDGTLDVDTFRVLFGTGAGDRARLSREFPHGAAVLTEGGDEAAGYLVFHDAWLVWQPNLRPLKQDTITVHHPEYYSQSGKRGAWPTDFDDPNPVPFIVARPKLKFLFAVEGPEVEWTEFGAQLLRWALTTQGAGSKTNAGYGRFRTWQGMDGTPIGGTPADEATGTAPGAATAPVVLGPGKHAGCRVRERQHQGRTEARIDKEGTPTREVPQNVWQPARQKLSEGQRKAAQRGRLMATVILTFSGTTLTGVALEDVQILEG